MNRYYLISSSISLLLRPFVFLMAVGILMEKIAVGVEKKEGRRDRERKNQGTISMLTFSEFK